MPKQDDLCTPRFSIYTVLLSAVFSGVFCLSLIGNTVVIVTILYRRTKSARSVTNFYLLNLAVADLLRSLTCILPTLLTELTHCWTLGTMMCHLVAFLQPVSVCASAYTLTVIAIERYYAICRPLHLRKWHTKKRALGLLCVVWLWSLLCNLVSFFIFDSNEVQKGVWTCNPIRSTTVMFFYQLYITLALLFIPLGLMVALYGNVICTLNGALDGENNENSLATILTQRTSSRSSDESLGSEPRGPFVEWLCKVMNMSKKKKISANNCKEMETLSLPGMANHDVNGNSARNAFTRGSFARRSLFGILTPRSSLDSSLIVLRSTNQEKILSSKRRVTRMLMTIVVLFAICWTPNYLFWLIVRFCDLFDAEVFNNTLNSVLTTLTYVSSCTNPITYCFMNKSFRHSLLSVCRRKTHSHSPKRFVLKGSNSERPCSPRINNNNNNLLPLIKVDMVEVNGNSHASVH
ncbi:unnamed protein product, partial [Mesorhabditis belari]|uniref:G-protein coupled receptors family 1 profile domain-containing protein n=1 Tax=Mesorhabditis belari TaxID=2138241 RepID=A0AAF3F3V2_9BILA